MLLQTLTGRYTAYCSTLYTTVAFPSDTLLHINIYPENKHHSPKIGQGDKGVLLFS